VLVRTSRLELRLLSSSLDWRTNVEEATARPGESSAVLRDIAPGSWQERLPPAAP
jgi:hypothetical protein